MKKLVLGLILVAVATMTWRARTQHDAPEAKLLFDRFWIDHEPRAPKEQFLALFVNGEHPFGHFAVRTVWTGQWEGVHYHITPREEGTIDFLFGATHEIQRVHYTARRCAENGFDFCLELQGTSRGTRHYYSKKEWVVKSDDPDTVRSLLPAAVQAATSTH